MLIEIKDVIQNESDKLRRWFHDDYFDLYTWETPDGALQGFQLCYAKLGKERALRWSAEAGYAHEDCDEGNWWIENDHWCRRWNSVAPICRSRFSGRTPMSSSSPRKSRNWLDRSA